MEPNPINQPSGDEQQPFKSFATQEEFDNFSAHLIKKTEEKANKQLKEQLTKEIREQIENEAKMDGEQKLKAEREKFNNEMKEQRTSLNKDIAKSMLISNGFEDAETETFLSFVTDDRESSIAKIQTICDNRKAYTEKLQNKWNNNLKSNQPGIETGGGSTDDLQTQYNNAKKAGRTADMSRLIREASAKGVQLKD